MILAGDTRNLPLESSSVQCCVTSPPYWGLRKYAGEQELVWGGEEGCEHDFSLPTQPRRQRSEADATTEKQKSNTGSYYDAIGGNFCRKCGAWRGAYGLEPVADCLGWAREAISLCNRCYVCHTVLILREIRRVLRDDGVCFWNLGDSYAGSWGNYGARNGQQRTQRKERFQRDAWEDHKGRPPMAGKEIGPGLKPKDLCLIPQRVALAAQRDGWWVRSWVNWCKPNPMPESCLDRPTDAWEAVLILAKDCTRTKLWKSAQRESHFIYESPGRSWLPLTCECCRGRGCTEEHKSEESQPTSPIRASRKGSLFHDDRDVEVRPSQGRHSTCCYNKATGKGKGWTKLRIWTGLDYYWDAEAVAEPVAETTVTRVALAESRKAEADNQSTSGQAYKRCESARVSRDTYQDARDHLVVAPKNGKRNLRNVWAFPTQPYKGAHFAVFPEELPRRCIKAATKPGDIVLDPFAGSGTTGKVALELGRKPVLVDLAYRNEEGYSPLARKRLSGVQRQMTQ